MKVALVMIMCSQIIDLTDWEKKENFLEGTGSMIFDRINKICFAAISNRTSSVVLKELCDILHYDLFTFKANQTYNNNRVPIYHTNVMMSLGEKFVVICLESIDDITEKSKIISLLKKLKKEIIKKKRNKLMIIFYYSLQEQHLGQYFCGELAIFSLREK